MRTASSRSPFSSLNVGLPVRIGQQRGLTTIGGIATALPPKDYYLACVDSSESPGHADRAARPQSARAIQLPGTALAYCDNTIAYTLERSEPQSDLDPSRRGQHKPKKRHGGHKITDKRPACLDDTRDVSGEHEPNRGRLIPHLEEHSAFNRE